MTPMKSDQGGFYLNNLNSRRVIARRKVYKVLIIKVVIDRVERLARQAKMKPI